MKRDFTQEEAEAKVGKKIRTLAAWAGVPRGTTGTVVKADPMGRVKPLDKDPQTIWDVVIEWDCPSRLSVSTSHYRTGLRKASTKRT